MTDKDKIADLQRRLNEVVRQIANLPVRWADGGGGGGGKIESAFAIVTEEAGESTHTAGGITLGSVGTCHLLDEDGAVASGEPADVIEFKSVHRVKIPAGTIIEISAPNEIKMGSTWDENKVLGRFVDVVDETWQQTGRAPKTSWVVPEGATDPEDQRWLGGTCATPNAPAKTR